MTQCYGSLFVTDCSVVWHFCSVYDMKKIEKVQYRALKYIYNDFDSSYSVLRKKGQRPLMYIERLKEMLVEVYKSYYKINPKYLNENVIVNSQNLICVIK